MENTLFTAKHRRKIVCLNLFLSLTPILFYLYLYWMMGPVLVQAYFFVFVMAFCYFVGIIVAFIISLKKDYVVLRMNNLRIYHNDRAEYEVILLSDIAFLQLQNFGKIRFFYKDGKRGSVIKLKKLKKEEFLNQMLLRGIKVKDETK